MNRRMIAAALACLACTAGLSACSLTGTGDTHHIAVIIKHAGEHFQNVMAGAEACASEHPNVTIDIQFPPEKAVLVLLCIIYGKLMLRVLLYTAFHLVHAHARVYNSRQQEQYDCTEPNSERCIQKGAEILCIYADIVLENLSEQRQ